MHLAGTQITLLGTSEHQPVYFAEVDMYSGMQEYLKASCRPGGR